MANILKSIIQSTILVFGEMAIWGAGNLGRWQFGEMGMYIPYNVQIHVRTTFHDSKGTAMVGAVDYVCR